MSESVVVEQSWTEKVTDMVAKLVGVKEISWGGRGAWRGPHVVALADFELPSVDSYTIKEGTKVFVDKDTYPVGPYRLNDGRTIPVANVTMTMSPGQPTPVEGDAPESAESGITFYLGTVSITYRYEPSSLTIKKGGLAYLEAEEKMGVLVQEAEFRGRVMAASVQVCKLGDTVPSHDIGPIQLMCFELYPYAAMRAGLLSTAKFFRQLTAEGGDDGKSADWAQFFGANLRDAQRITALETQRFRRGDMIILYEDTGIAAHTVIASGQVDPGGGGDMVYSLAEFPGKGIGCWPIKPICTSFLPIRFLYAKAFTPAPPSD